jgi:hypothetical protein
MKLQLLVNNLKKKTFREHYFLISLLDPTSCSSIILFYLQVSGIYTACFSNEFSTFSHKLIYMDFQVGDNEPLTGIVDHATVLTQMETSAQEIHKSLNSILDFQTHHRLREAQGE